MLWCPHHVLLDDPTRYCQVVGSLVYLTIALPKIKFVAHMWSSNSFLAYCLNFCSLGCCSLYLLLPWVHYGSHIIILLQLVFSSFSDFDWAGDVNDHCSTTCSYSWNLLSFLGRARSDLQAPFFYWKPNIDCCWDCLVSINSYRSIGSCYSTKKLWYWECSFYCLQWCLS